MTTLTDVARLAGVSVSTASYVLSGKRPISEPTRQRVLAAMDDLGFRPNNQGRALASGKTRTLALLYPSLESLASPMPMEFVTAAASQAEHRGYALILSTTNDAEEDVLSLIQRGFVDGYVLMEITMSDPRIDLLKIKNVPFAIIGRQADNTGLHFVDLDFQYAVDLAVDHLLDLGHRHIGLLCRSAGESLGYGPTVRMRERFEERQRDLGFCGLFHTCGGDPHDGETAFEMLLAIDPNLTALISSNTEAISGIVKAAAAMNVSIPADVSLVGMLSPRIAEFLVPPITGIDFPAEEMGQRGVDLLIDQLEGRVQEPQQLVLSPSITVRSSTARVLTGG